jgi:hypothetical protein
MKLKLVSIFLLFLFIYNIFGYLIVFEGMLSRIRDDVETTVKNNLNDYQNVVLIIPESTKGIHWLNDTEFLLNGELYDVLKKEINYDSVSDKYSNLQIFKSPNLQIILYCLNDKAEEKLFSDLKKQVNNNTDNNAPVNQKTKNLLKLIPEFTLLILSYILHHTSYIILRTLYIVHYSLFTADCPSPPPKITSASS